MKKLNPFRRKWNRECVADIHFTLLTINVSVYVEVCIIQKLVMCNKKIIYLYVYLVYHFQCLKSDNPIQMAKIVGRVCGK